MENGTYKTKAGSTVVVYGNGSNNIMFDWFEEDHACIECRDVHVCNDDWLSWYCDEDDCRGGMTELYPCSDESTRVKSQTISRRDYFAGKAMEGLLANPYHAEFSQPLSNVNVKKIADMAVNQANELIKALQYTEPTNKKEN